MIMLSTHVARRLSQRNMKEEDIALVMRHGQSIHKAGALFYFLRQRDIPYSLRANDRIAKLEGTVIVLSRITNTLITVYRNKLGIRNIRKKSKRYQPNRRIVQC